MQAAITLLAIAFAAASGAALGQATSSGIGAGTGSSATSGSTGFGIPNVPNNRLPPLPESTTPSLGTPRLGAPTTTTPNLSTTTPGVSTTTPGSTGSTTPGVTIELSPPISNAPGSSTQTRTCPSGLTYC